MASQPVPHYTAEQYLRIDRKSEFNNEFIFGEIVPMVGGTPAHRVICGNVYYEFRVRLSGGSCCAYNTSLRVCLDRDNLYAYPDVTVVCGQLEYTDEEEDTVTNPKVVVEVLSPSTKNFDLGETLRWYWGIASLTDIVLIGQKKLWIEHWFRAPACEWAKRVLDNMNDKLRIESTNCEIPVGELYAGVKFPV